MNNFGYKVICNIPHSSLQIPNWAMIDYIVPKEYLVEFSNKMVDKDIDKIFSFVPNDCKVVSDISRVVVDMERFREDKSEPMSELGMGLFYTKDDKGVIIRKRGNTYNKCLSLYDAYHKELTEKVGYCLKMNDYCCVLDCHSFHDNLDYTGFQTDTFPDICLGFNEVAPIRDILWVQNLFENNGYFVSLNMPFSGSLVPLKYIEDSRVRSIMIELNRRVYDNSVEDFMRVQNLCKIVYEYLNGKVI